MSTLKRSATIAFGFELGHIAPDAILRPQSAPATPKRKPSLLSRTPSTRRTVGSRTPSLSCQPSINRSTSLLSASTPTPSPSSHRAIKRQKTSHNGDWESSWEVVDLPLSSGEVVHSLRPMPRLSAATIAASATNTSKYLYSTTSRLLATLGLVQSTAAANLPHQPQPTSLAINIPTPIISTQNDGDIVLVEADAQLEKMDIVCDEEEEACILSIVRSDSIMSDMTKPLPPSPFLAYTPLQWSLISRYPCLLERALSKRCQTTREAHARFDAGGYLKEENPKFHKPTPRRTSLLAPYSPRPLTPVVRSKTPAPMVTDRTVRAAQSLGPGSSRWANYPTCTRKYPGPDNAGSLLRNTLRLNFGDWLKQINLWNTINIGSLRMAMECYELLGNEAEGAATPTASTPSGSIADLRELLERA